MKVPFQLQTSDYDCVPTTIINALSYLFHRKDIPPPVVQKVYSKCLDVEHCRGTSEEAIRSMGSWLNRYRDKRYGKFAIQSRFVHGDKVHFRQDSRLLQCMTADGVVLLCIHSSRGYWHYILVLRHEDGWLHCHDPSPRSKRFIDNDAVRFVDTPGWQEANLVISIDWLEKNFDTSLTADERKYVLGRTTSRQCLLMKRIRR